VLGNVDLVASLQSQLTTVQTRCETLEGQIGELEEKLELRENELQELTKLRDDFENAVNQKSYDQGFEDGLDELEKKHKKKIKEFKQLRRERDEAVSDRDKAREALITAQRELAEAREAVGPLRG